MTSFDDDDDAAIAAAILLGGEFSGSDGTFWCDSKDGSYAMNRPYVTKAAAARVYIAHMLREARQ